MLTSSYYRLLSITPGDILNKIALLFKWQGKNICRERYMFMQCSFSETAKEVLKRGWQKKASCNDVCCVCRCKSKSYCKNFKCRVSTKNLHYVFDIGDHPTAVKCLPIAAESFR